MHLVYIYSIISVVIVSLISLVGIFTIYMNDRKLKKILLYLVSFSAGALLGDVFIHLLPQIIESTGFTVKISLYVIFGIAFSFIIEKIIHWRHCHVAEQSHIHPFSMVNLYGDTIHNFIDGIIIGASYLVNMQVGIATTVAVIMHEIPQEIGDFAVLLYGGTKKSKALFYNFLSSLSAVFGLLLALVTSSYIQAITDFLIPFAAGTFIYIAAADLIPELHKEVAIKKSIIQLALLLLGVIVMLTLLLVG